jgi:hypothetical protein
VGLQDSPDVVGVIEWLDAQRISGAILVADIWFVGWAKVYLKSMPVYQFLDRTQVDGAALSGFDHVFTLYWAVGVGGYQTGHLPSKSSQIFVIGRIALYEIGKQ